MDCSNYVPTVLKTKKPRTSARLNFVGGPSWARTKDPLIMSQVL